jgi:hypothetical protein
MRKMPPVKGRWFVLAGPLFSARRSGRSSYYLPQKPSRRPRNHGELHAHCECMGGRAHSRLDPNDRFNNNADLEKLVEVLKLSASPRALYYSGGDSISSRSSLLPSLYLSSCAFTMCRSWYSRTCVPPPTRCWIIIWEFALVNKERKAENGNVQGLERAPAILLHRSHSPVYCRCVVKPIRLRGE